MTRTPLRSVFLILPVVLAACGGLPTRTFRFDVLDVEERPLPALVVVDGDWAGAATNKRFVNVGNKDDELELKLEFERAEVEVTIAAVQVDPDTGEPTRVPKSRSEPSDYMAEPRRLRATDPAKQLFILPRR